MEKLRQALKTLSEAEKQLRTSSDKLTWLTAALLQLAPDQQYMMPSSSADSSFNQSPLTTNNAGGREITRRGGENAGMLNCERGFSTDVRLENFVAGSSGDFIDNAKMKGIRIDRKRHAGTGVARQPTGMIRMAGNPALGKSRNGLEEIWLEVLEKIQNHSIKEFLSQEGRLISFSLGAGTFYNNEIYYALLNM